MGHAETADLKTKPLRKSAAPLDFGYSHSLSVAAGSRALQELQRVLRSREEQDSDVFFALKTHGVGGKERELGQGYVNLRQLLKDARNMEGAQVSLAGPQGSAGRLTVSVVGLQALQAASSGAPTSAADAFLGRGVGTGADTLRVAVGGMALAEMLKMNKGITHLNLSGNKLRSEVCKELSHALKENNRLRTLILHEGVGVRYKHGDEWRDGIISEISDDPDRYIIDYDNGEQEERVQRWNIRLRQIGIGRTVERYWWMTDSTSRPRSATSRCSRRMKRTSPSVSTKILMSSMSRSSSWS